MRNFVVEVREVHVTRFHIQADDLADAKRKVSEGEGKEEDDSTEFSHTLDSDTWEGDECFDAGCGLCEGGLT